MGAKSAESICSYRDKQGPYKTFFDLCGIDSNNIIEIGLDALYGIEQEYGVKGYQDKLGKYDKVIVSDSFQPDNIRLFKDTTHITEYASFKNMGRSEVYDLSPYDETLVIDADYFIMNDILDQVWDSENDVMINCKYRDVSGRHKENIEYLDNFSIPMYWATVFYFKKSDFAKNLFTLISHIKYNYKYYYYLYNCSGNLFRNDFAFSMALHILNGSVAFDVPSLPFNYLNNRIFTP